MILRVSQSCRKWWLMNSDPLSESMPAIGRGNSPQAWSIASITHRRDRFGEDRFGKDRFGKDRFGKDRFGRDRFTPPRGQDLPRRRPQQRPAPRQGWQ